MGLCTASLRLASSPGQSSSPREGAERMAPVVWLLKGSGVKDLADGLLRGGWILRALT